MSAHDENGIRDRLLAADREHERGAYVVAGPAGRFLCFREYRLIGADGRPALRTPGQVAISINAALVISVSEDATDPACTLLHAVNSLPIQVQLPVDQVLALLAGTEEARDGA